MFEKLLRDGLECTWAFLSAENTILNSTVLKWVYGMKGIM